MNWYKLSRYFTIDTKNDKGEFQEQSKMDASDAREQADEIFDANSMKRRKPLREVVMPDDEDKIVGGLAEGWVKIEGEADKSIYEFGFDLSILKDFQQKGIGRQLINNAIKRYDSEKSAYEEMGFYTRIKIWAVNPNVARMLEDEHGFDCQPVAYDKGEPIQWFCYKY